MLIILATVSINAVMGENGLIRRGELASQYQANAEAEDNAKLDELDEHIANAMVGEGNVNPPPTGTTLEQAKADTMLTKTENTKITIGEDTVWIPAGFKVHEDSANVVDEGIVITDGTNEFVWVPVNDASFTAMFGTSNTALALCGETGVTTNYYSNLRVRSVESSFAATTPGTTSVTVNSSSVNGVREPDLVPKYDELENSYYNNPYYKQAGFESSTEMAEAFVEDYTNMRASIAEYDGFYIGRYELTGSTTNPTVQAGAVLTELSSQAGNWYGLYKACRDVKGNDEYVTSTMIWGCQWDETMNWIKNTKFNGDSTYIDSNSATWGNYSDSTGNAQLKEADGTTNAYGKPQNTGYSKEYWSANNICDLAGNYHEVTQEANSDGFRVSRGRLWLRAKLYLSSFRSQLV